MKRLLIIGPNPQNIGGISCHIKRLVGLIEGNYDIDFIDEGHTRYEGYFNLRGGNLFYYLKKIVNADIVHIHSGVWFLRIFHVIICKFLFRKKVLVTIHRDPNIEPYRKITRWFLRYCDCSILVNKEGYDFIKSTDTGKCVLLPAFLPPLMKDEPQLPNELENWLKVARKNPKSYIMCSNAWNLVLHNGFDLYGLDICIDAMERLKTDETDYYLIFVVASNTNQRERIEEYKRRVKDYGLERNILIWEEPVSFVRLLQKCDLTLRTTNTDGDAISIRESLYFDKPVLASDIVSRPDGVAVFKTRNINDLVRMIKEITNRTFVLRKDMKIDYQKMFLEMYEK